MAILTGRRERREIRRESRRERRHRHERTAAYMAAHTTPMSAMQLPRSSTVGRYLMPGARGGKPVAITAAAQVLAGPSIAQRPKRPPVQPWQTDSFGLRREVGEFRFSGERLGRALSQVRLYIGHLPAGASAPVEVTDGPVGQLSRDLYGDQGAQQMSMRRACQHLTYAGESNFRFHLHAAEDGGTAEDGGGELEGRLSWDAWSVRELTGSGEQLKLNDGTEDIAIDPARDLLVRCWYPDPELRSLADAPAQAVLPVVRELRDLTKHTAAQIESRLAGAGLLALPDTVTLLKGQYDASGRPADAPEADEFVEALVESMTVPLTDRESAASVVPLVIKVPPDAVDKIKHITFFTEFDEMAKDMREEAIRRIALGMDSDPSVQLGMGGSNHWSAWLISEDESKLVIAPIAATICHAHTTGFVRPYIAELDQSVDPDEYVVCFDLGELELRPDKSSDSRSLNEAGLLSDAVTLRENGFGLEDAPDAEEYARWMLRRVLLAKPDWAPVILPALGITVPGLDELAAAAAGPAPAEGTAPDTGPPPDTGPDGDRSIPDTRTDPPPATTEDPTS